jgi:anti-sigma regulatory factor (Ser/Thr protein kinase)
LSIRRSFPPDERAPTAARESLKRLRIEDDLSERAELVVSEVVTNCVRHAGLARSQRVRLLVSLVPSLLRIEVTDERAGFDPIALRPEASSEVGGWGLWLVEELTDRWGLEPGHSIRVRCEFDRVPA